MYDTSSRCRTTHESDHLMTSTSMPLLSSTNHCLTYSSTIIADGIVVVVMHFIGVDTYCPTPNRSLRKVLRVIHLFPMVLWLIYGHVGSAKCGAHTPCMYRRHDVAERCMVPRCSCTLDAWCNVFASCMYLQCTCSVPARCMVHKKSY